MRNFNSIAKEHGVHPSEVATLVLATGTEFVKIFGSNVVDDDDLPNLVPLLTRLKDRKRAMKAG
jgi:hypothetical protein